MIGTRAWIERLIVMVLALAVLGVSSGITPRPEAFGLKRLAPERIRVLQPGGMSIPVQPAASTVDLPYSDQLSWDKAKPRQYHFTVLQPHASAILVPVLGGESKLWLNGIPITEGIDTPYRGAGLGRQYLSHALPQVYAKFAENRVDIVTESDLGNVGLGPVYVGSPQQVDEATRALTESRDYLKFFANLAAWFGFGSALAGMVLGKHSINFLGGLLLSAAILLGMVNFGWVDHLPSQLLPAISFTATIMLCWRSLSAPSYVREIYSALGLSALFATASGLILTVVPNVWYLPSSLIDIINLGTLPVLIFGLPLLLLADIRQYLDVLRSTRAELAEKETIISRQEAALQEQIRTTAVVEERQRFVRDMHDGVGGQLLSLLTRVRMRKVSLDDVEEEIQRGIADLRLVADSLDNVGNDLDSALATFHARAKQQLDAANIAFRWQKAEHFSGAILEPRQILNLYRFLQEALSNTVRHSGARNFSIEFFFSENDAGRGVIVTDDGRGFDQSAVLPGHGLSNMQTRAAKLNGILSITHGAHGVGTILTLTMPDIVGVPTNPANHSAPPRK